MLEITPNVDKLIIMPYCKNAKCIFSNSLYLYRALDNGEVIAAGLFEIGPDYVQVLYYETQIKDDFFLLDAVLRAGLNYACTNGITMGYIGEEFRLEQKLLFEKLNYPSVLKFDITNFFQKYKNCKSIM